MSAEYAIIIVAKHRQRSPNALVCSVKLAVRKESYKLTYSSAYPDTFPCTRGVHPIIVVVRTAIVVVRGKTRTQLLRIRTRRAVKPRNHSEHAGSRLLAQTTLALSTHRRLYPSYSPQNVRSYAPIGVDLTCPASALEPCAASFRVFQHGERGEEGEGDACSGAEAGREGLGVGEQVRGAPR